MIDLTEKPNTRVRRVSLRSPVRENCTPGSVRGRPGNRTCLPRYSPQLGRWTAIDPISELGGLNIYAFVANRALGYKDYKGLAITEFASDPNTHPVEPNSGVFGASGLVPGALGVAIPSWVPLISSKKVSEDESELKVEGSLGVRTLYNSDKLRTNSEIESTKAHERDHVAIYKKWWNEMKADLDGFDGFTDSCSCITLHHTYAQAISKWYFGRATVENGEYDQAAYNGGEESIARGTTTYVNAGELKARTLQKLIDEGCKTPPSL